MQRYRALFATSHVAGAVAASIIGRLPISITGFAILLYAQAETSSFERAGAISAIYVLGLALLAPFLGRLIDRLGPKPVLTFGAIAYPAALISLVALTSPNSIWIALVAALAGASLPPITVCMRALYPQLINDDALISTAYSLDAALIEAIFVAGPVIVSAFAAYHRPQDAIVLAALCASLGSFLFLRSRAVRDWKKHAVETPRSAWGPLTEPGLRTLFFVTLLNACAFGLFEIAVTGLAARQGYPAAAGAILGLASVGTTLGVLIYGSRSWWPSLPKQFFYTLLMMAAGILSIAPFENLYLLGALVIVACAPMSVALAITSLLISKIAPRQMLAESFTWMATFLLVGISIGLAGGGVLVEHTSPFAVFVFAAMLTGAAAATVGGKLPLRVHAA
jgi:MFS family permease